MAELSGVVELLLIILLPKIIGWASNLYKSRTSPSESAHGGLSRSRPIAFSRTDQVVYGVLSALLIFYSMRAWIATPPNIFSTLKAQPNTGCRALRARFSAYAKDHWPSEVDMADADIPPGSSISPEYMLSKQLVDRFCKYPKDRVLYQIYGERAYLNAITSPYVQSMESSRYKRHGSVVDASDLSTSDELPLLLYQLPSVAFEYITMALTIRFITDPKLATQKVPGRGWWKTWGFLILSALASADIIALINMRGAPNFSLWRVNPWHNKEDFYCSSVFTRRMLLAGLTLLFGLFDYLRRNQISNLQMMNAIHNDCQNSLQVLNSARVMRRAVLKDRSLRESFTDFWASRVSNPQQSTTASETPSS